MSDNSNTASVGETAVLKTLREHGDLTHQRSKGKTMGTVIVALPEEGEDVYRVSTEPVPHMTILYLGETTDAQNEIIADYLEHIATNTLRRFGLSVDHRDELGEDKADVLLFRKNWENKDISLARSHMLKNDTLKAAFDSADQYPDWLPHLTLGYPDRPAKDDEMNGRRFYYIQFDRLALWTGDSEGPEFRLMDYGYESEDMAMATVDSKNKVFQAIGLSAIEKFFAHHGVKGMRWGVRRRRTSGGNYTVISEDAASARRLLSGSAKAASNAEIRSALDRMRLESDFAKLQATMTPPSRAARVKKFVGKLMGEIGSEQVTRVARGAASVAVENALQDKKVSGKDFATQVGKRIVPGKKK